MIKEEARPGVQLPDGVHIFMCQFKLKDVEVLAIQSFAYNSRLPKNCFRPLSFWFDFDVGCRIHDKTILADHWTILQKQLHWRPP